MLSVANRIDSALQFGFSISRIGLLVIKLLGFLLTPPYQSPDWIKKHICFNELRNELISSAHTQRLSYLQEIVNIFPHSLRASVAVSVGKQKIIY